MPPSSVRRRPVTGLEARRPDTVDRSYSVVGSPVFVTAINPHAKITVSSPLQ
jgi:hypothetical protein